VFVCTPDSTTLQVFGNVSYPARRMASGNATCCRQHLPLATLPLATLCLPLHTTTRTRHPPPHHTHTRTRTPLTHTLSLPQACLNLCLWSHEVVGPTSVVNGTSTYVLTQPLPAVGWRGGWITR
jgi:hypothetical protein